MNLHAAIETDFTVYDGRRHVLGASMLAAMDKALRQASGVDETVPFHVKRAKFMRKTGCNGVLYTAEGGTRPVGIEDAAAHAVGRLGDKMVEIWFIPDERRTVLRDQPSTHEISGIVPAGAFGGNCRARGEGLESVLCLLVDVNKMVQLAGQGVHKCFSNKLPVTELVYLEDLLINVELARLDTEVRVESMGERRGGNRVYTLNRLHFISALGHERACRVGFSFEARKDRGEP
jgi:hypothetical protein